MSLAVPQGTIDFIKEALDLLVRVEYALDRGFAVRPSSVLHESITQYLTDNKVVVKPPDLSQYRPIKCSRCNTEYQHADKRFIRI